MSESIKQAFYHALAARGAYANLTTSMDEIQLRNALQTTALSGMSLELANYFISHFKVTDSVVTGSLTGYNGLVLQEKNAQGNLINHYILANRGTEIPELSDCHRFGSIKRYFSRYIINISRIWPNKSASLYHENSD